MVLTPTEEAALLQKYEPLLLANVRAYCRRVSLPFSDFRNDLLQEARYAFLLHIRRINSEADIHKCGYELLNALCVARESTHVVRIPHSEFKKNSGRFVRSAGDGPTNVLHDQKPSGIVDELVARQFLDTLSADERTIITMKMAGYKAREILPHTSLISDMHMNRCVEGIKEKARKYFAFHHKSKGGGKPHAIGDTDVRR